MISASKSTLSLNNLKILWYKVTKILQICLRSFVNPHPDSITFSELAGKSLELGAKWAPIYYKIERHQFLSQEVIQLKKFYPKKQN